MGSARNSGTRGSNAARTGQPPTVASVMSPAYGRGGSGRRPARVAAGEPEDGIEPRCGLGHRDDRTEQSGQLTLIAAADLANGGLDLPQRLVVAVERQSGGLGDVPAVNDQLIERDPSGERTR